MSSNQKPLKEICDELIEAFREKWRGFQEDDVPIFLVYGYIPPEREHEGLYADDEFEIEIEHDLVKSSEISLLNGDREEIMNRSYINLLREYSPRIDKYTTRQFRIYTCKEAFRKGYSKEIQEIIKFMKKLEKRKRWFDTSK